MTRRQSFKSNVDSEMTPWRAKVKDLQTHRRIGASAGCFDCEHYKSCAESLGEVRMSKGDWTYIGRQYGRASISGKRARILFVSMERPGDREYEEFECTQREFRESAFDRVNPHMAGVDVELEHLLDDEVPVNRCQQFALTNSVRCHPATATYRSQSTSQMKVNCASHTKAIVDVLSPDVIVVQGRDRDCGITPEPIGAYGGSGTTAEIGKATVKGKGVLILQTAHPAFYSRRGFQWKEGRLPAELGRLFRRARRLYPC